MPRKKPRVVSLDEVRIHRDGKTAHFDYADESIGGMALTLGVDVSKMSDEELLERHNEVVRSMDYLRATHEHVAVEVPIGSPQIQYHERSDQWTPRGDVLRCIVHDGGDDGEATIEIDDRELSLREFGRLLTTYAGWGMRIVFVPDDEIHEAPIIEVREPDKSSPPPAEAEALEPMRARTRGVARSAKSDKKAGAPGRREQLISRKPIYRLRVSLVGAEPPIWRNVLVSGNSSLKRVHEVIQSAMGWTNSHLHLFASADRKTVVSDPRFQLDDTRDEGRVKLRSFAPGVGSRFLYEYDLGDSWEHEVVVEDILEPGKAGSIPRCLAGERACPPEDCGGIPGYFDLVTAMQDPRHPERQHYRDWLGGDFEPEAFDLDEVNRLLRRLK